jgi:hypothetical protein
LALGYELLVLVVILLQRGVFLFKFLDKGILILDDPMRDDLGSNVIKSIRDPDSMVYSLVLSVLILVNSEIFVKNSVLLSVRYVEHLLDIQALHQVFSQDKWSPDNYVINVLASECHQYSFLNSDDRVRMTFIIFGHIIVPNSNVKEIT